MTRRGKPGAGGQKKRRTLNRRSRAWREADAATDQTSIRRHRELKGTDPWSISEWAKRRESNQKAPDDKPESPTG